MINGRLYGWGDIVINIGGVPVAGVRGIEYGEAQEKVNVYGAGRQPIGRGYGRVACEGSITLEGSTVIALQDRAPAGQLHRIAPFSITVIYQPETGPIVRDVLRNAEFTNNPTSWTEGDMTRDVQLTLIIGSIKRNA